MHSTAPKVNGEWWAEKLATNRRRDASTDDHLRGLGWLVLRFWEHEDMAEAAAVVEAAWRDRVGASSPAPPERSPGA